MAETKTSGFIIDKTNYAEQDCIVKVLTENQIISFIAKGIRKPLSKNRASLTLLSLSELEIFMARMNNKLSKLKRATTISAIDYEKDDTKKVAMWIAQYLNKLDKTSFNLYKALLQALPMLGQDFNHQIKTYIVAQTLPMHGLNPIYTYCIECGTQSNIADFSFYKGGLLCAKHKTRSLDLAILKAYINLGTNFEQYLITNSEVNKIIFNELSDHIKSTLY